MAVTMFPTPRASDTEGGIPKNVELKNGTFSRVNKDGVRWGVKLKDAVGGQLNPRWVSWLMGLPENWCNVDPIGGPKNPTSQESQQESQNESQN